MDTSKAKIYVRYDGWHIKIGNHLYFYDHEDDDYGAPILKALLEDLGVGHVEVEQDA